MTDSLIFSKRLRLAELFEEWRQANSASMSGAEVSRGAHSVITWLSIEGLLDVEKARLFLEEHGK